jgi:hypothetical protein
LATIGAHEAVVSLELETSHGRILVDRDGSTEIFRLPVGTSDVVVLFRRDPPTEGELEIAIELIEASVMPLTKKLPPDGTLVAAGDLTRELACVSTGSRSSVAASRDAVESQFEQIALAARRGAWSREVHMTLSLAAGLLILREFMQHAGFDRIELRNPGAG